MVFAKEVMFGLISKGEQRLDRENEERKVISDSGNNTYKGMEV